MDREKRPCFVICTACVLSFPIFVLVFQIDSEHTIGDMSRSLVYVIGIPLVFAILFHFVSQKPPLDFGNGFMFDNIAKNYDLINRALSLNMDRGWRKVMIKEVTSDGLLYKTDDAKTKRIKVLDLATGTADVAILIAEAYREIKNTKKAQLEVVGIDPSKNMLALGSEKVSAKKLNDLVTLQIGDVRNLSVFKDNTFDIVTMSFGIRNIPEKEAAFCQIWRVLQKKKNIDSSGTLAFLEFSEPGEGSGVLGFVARLFIHYLVPIIGAVLSGAPREYMHLQNSIREFPSPSEFARLIESSKCGKDRRGSFLVEKVIPMNFNSVHVYVARPIITK